MIEWLSRKHREQKRKDANEQALKDALAKKMANYQSMASITEFDYTEIVIDGKLLRVEKENITIGDVLSGQNSKSVA